jgi:(E)-4-hydroxy-3-methylbut-2-enyl-diphosphate synthase
VIDAARQHKVAIRIGVNEASIRDLKGQPVPYNKRISLMLKEIQKYIRLFDRRGFDQLVLSSKSTDTLRTIEINQRIADAFDFPMHLGLTHAGLPDDARIPSAVALGSLLSQGIGDTIRVSAAGNPVIETRMACDILTSLGLRTRTQPELIVCPTCGRTEIDVIKLAKRVKKGLADVTRPVRIAVMGCVVNGPGEAEDADLAICAGKGKAFLYKDGKKIAVVQEEHLMTALLDEIEKLSPKS